MKKPVVPSRTINVLRSYSFVDKDPVIDVIRTLVQDSGNSYNKIHDASGVSTTTISNWFHGKTRRPTYACIMAVARAIGGECRWFGSDGKEIKVTRTTVHAVPRKKNGP
jgi:transcriptional regulator with XRE-family HTH domain